MIGHMAHRVPGHVDHPAGFVADGHAVALGHGLIERRQPMGICGGAHDPRGMFGAQGVEPLDMVGMVMGEQNVAGRPAARGQRIEDRRRLGHVDDRRGTGGRIVGTLARILQQQGGRYGCATMCCGGGQGTAVIIENEKN